jgi:hypothetical protein
MASFHKFLIGDLVAYKIRSPAADYLFGKEYGIVIGHDKGNEGQTYYKVHWTNDHPRNILNLFCYAQLNLIAPAQER